MELMRKKIFDLLLLTSIILGGFSCTKSTDPSKSSSNQESIAERPPVDFDYSKIKERGKLIAIMDNSSTGLFLYRGQTMGYEYELLKMFCDTVGLELEIKLEPNLERAFEMLNQGEGDVLAHNLTVTKERKNRISFTHYHNLVRQVLIQRKPEGWRDMKLHEIEKTLIRNPVELIGKEIYVRYRSAYLDRLSNLSDEIGGDILIIEDFPEVETEGIIKRVANGEIDFTVAEENIALVNSTYYPILDIKTAISFPQQIAWGLRRNADTLQQVMNDWILDMRKTSDYYAVYNRYFRSSKASRIRNKSEFSSIGGDKISPYDNFIKEGAQKIGWDWRLLAAQIYKESKFNPKIVSWAGAIGLLQVLPSTGEAYGFKNLKHPETNLKAGIRHIQWLQSIWDNVIADSLERQKFILASYNVGQGHVEDARRLTEKYGGNPDSWEEVSIYLLKKQEPEFYNDEVVEFGYCRGSEPVRYVKVIFETYENYTLLFPSEEPAIGSSDLQS